ncbi:damage-inducible protein DinB [Taibaiella sp. KBW10]|uniref:DinB family protein n=1 Tax=Taibaiella sp. KBW10 TaxID=2153357 RepID=UPI000F5B4372|nr:DinB family protein [Taibaiella sp. KBW10]RQO30043.1 damage-inducible protein DinB [Taibaiella sp. KBW10]
MDTLKQLKDELTHEYQTTKKFFSQFPEAKNDYAPHEKSMKMMPLSRHIAEVFGWPEVILNTSDLDFAAGDNKPEPIEDKAALEAKLDAEYQKGIAALDKAAESDLEPNWSISMNGQKLAEWSKYGAIRHGLNQITHHRAQLGTYYRQLEIPLPGSYGPSADDQRF